MLEFLDLWDDLVALTHTDWESLHLYQHISKELVDLLDNGFRTEKNIVLLSPSTDFWLFLVECLQSFDIDEIDASFLSLFVMDSISKNADLVKSTDIP